MDLYRARRFSFGMEIGTRCLYSFFSSFLSRSLPYLFRLLDTSPLFESISNDLKYYGKTLPPLEQFHSCPFCHTLFFLFLMPNSPSKRRKLLTQRCYSVQLQGKWGNDGCYSNIGSGSYMSAMIQISFSDYDFILHWR